MGAACLLFPATMANDSKILNGGIAMFWLNEMCSNWPTFTVSSSYKYINVIFAIYV